MSFRLKKIIKGIEKQHKNKVLKSEETPRLKKQFFCYFFKLVGKIGKSIKFLFSFLSLLGKYIRLINLNEKQRESIRERHYDY